MSCAVYAFGAFIKVEDEYEQYADENLFAVKVGISQDPDKRLRDLSQSTPLVMDEIGEPVYYASREDALIVERALKRLMRPWRIRGEWFKPDARENCELFSMLFRGFHSPEKLPIPTSTDFTYKKRGKVYYIDFDGSREECRWHTPFD